MGFQLFGINHLVSQQENVLLTGYEVGDRVEISPHLDRWMKGDRFGEVISIGRFYLHLKMDLSNTEYKVVPENIHRKIEFP